jgi:hypothetical protein
MENTAAMVLWLRHDTEVVNLITKSRYLNHRLSESQKDCWQRAMSLRADVFNIGRFHLMWISVEKQWTNFLFHEVVS